MKKTVKKKKVSAFDKTLTKSAQQAVNRAEIYGTTLVIKENGKIKELTPAQMKRRLAKKS